jgi:predicted Zn-dependent protease
MTSMNVAFASVRALAEAVRARVAAVTDDVEVRVERADQVSYAIEGRALIPELQCDTWRVAMRARKGGRLAIAATTGSSIDDAADALLRSLSAAQPDALEDFAVLHETPPDGRGWDDAVAAMIDRPAQVRALAVCMAEAARAAAASPEVVLDGVLKVGRTWRAMATARGATVLSASTVGSAFLMVDGNEWDSLSGTAAPTEQDVRALGRELIVGLPPREVTVAEWLGGPREVTVIIDPRLLESLLRSLFLERVGLDRVVSGLSRASVGDVVGSPIFSLFDDSGATASLAGAVIDDEGVIGQRKTVVERGVLRTLLVAWGGASTGNGFRLPLMAEDASEAPVRVGMGHLDMPEGNTPRMKLAPGRTVLLTDLLGIHSANKATGAFNNPVQGGVAVEDGVPVARLKAGAWSATGNFHAILRALSGVSAERMNTGTATLPWVAAPVRLS